MKTIALKFTYHYDIIQVPDNIACEKLSYQKKFDKWLYDKSNEHGCWVYVDGFKRAVSFDSDTFIDYLNKFHLSDSSEKACIIQKEIDNIPDGTPVLFF